MFNSYLGLAAACPDYDFAAGTPATPALSRRGAGRWQARFSMGFGWLFG